MCRIPLRVYLGLILPPIRELKATPTPHTVLLAWAAISPAHRVPWLDKNKIQICEFLKIEVYIEIQINNTCSR